MRNTTTLSIRRAMAIALIPAIYGLYGCTAMTTSAEWAKPTDSTTKYELATDNRHDWPYKIDTLPIEVHGALPNESSGSTASEIPFARPAPALADKAEPARQRVVLYVDDGADRPTRTEFCSAKKTVATSTSKPGKYVTLRAALCDGQRIVTYAKTSVPREDARPQNLGLQLASLKGAMIDSLKRPYSIMDSDSE